MIPIQLSADGLSPRTENARLADALPCNSAPVAWPRPAAEADPVAALHLHLQARQGLWSSRRVMAALLEDVQHRPAPAD